MSDRSASDEPEPDLPGPPLALDQLRPFGDDVDDDDVEGHEMLARLQASMFRRPATPRMIGRWLLLERKGAGAMGVVHAAYDPRLDRRVALKVLRPGRLDRPDARARMLREAQALAKISDPHVVHIYDVEELEGNVCLVMELIEGPTLEAWQREPRGQREILDRYIAVAHGLAKIHEAGLVHRDVKPSNVLVDGTRVVIADFGLVLADDEAGTQPRSTGPGSARTALELTLTEEGAFVGTLGYMAPEQLAGQGATARSDQYAFFVSLYEAITGVRPFRGTTPRAVAEAMALGPPSRSPSGVPVRRWLYPIMQRGLAMDPEQRFASMTEVEAALERGRDRGRRARALVVVIVGAAMAALGYGLGGQGEASEDPLARCEARLGQRRALWDERHTALLSAVRTRGRDVEVRAWEELARGFEAKDEQWRAGWLEVCERSARPTASAADLRQQAARQECLEAEETELRGYAEALAEADTPPALSEVERLHARLHARPDCRAVGDGAAAGTEPVEPVELVASLARARALEDLGELREVEALAAALAREAQARSLERLEGEARYVQGRALLMLGRPLEARDSFDAARRAAARAGDRTLAARTAVSLAKVDGNDLQDADGGRSWLRLAEHELLASGELDRRGPIHADYVEAQGLVAFTARDHAQAEAYHRAALDRRRELGAVVPALERLKSKSNLANALSRLGRKAEALALLEEAAAEADDRYGAQHPYLADVWINIGKVHQAEQRLDLAADAFRRAVAIDRARRERSGAAALRGLLALGHVAQMEGDDETLVDAAAQVREIHQRLAVEDPEAMRHVDRAAELQLVAAGRLAQGDVEGSMEALRRAAAILEPVDPLERAFVLVNLADVLQASGRGGEARTILQQALRVLESVPPAEADLEEIERVRRLLDDTRQ